MEYPVLPSALNGDHHQRLMATIISIKWRLPSALDGDHHQQFVTFVISFKLFAFFSK
jgi:hypothetical protein